MYKSDRGKPFQTEIGCCTRNGSWISSWISACLTQVNDLFTNSKGKPKLTNFLRLSNRSDIYIKCIHGTMVVWLQNNSGFTRWGPTESRVDALLEAFRPVREKERERLQQQLNQQHESVSDAPEPKTPT